MRMLIFYILLFFSIQSPVFAQEKWNLKSCIEQAMSKNLAVSQTEIQAKIAAINYQQSKLAIYPTLNFGTSSAFNTGNNQDPTTFTRVTENYLSAGMQLQSSADIFNFFRKKNTIAANHWELMATVANVNKTKYDIGLSTANAYLQVLLAKKQTEITAVQIQQTQTQLDITRKKVNAGTLPELNTTQLEAQLAMDSSNYISSNGNFTQAILALKLLMYIDPSAPFEIETPSIDSLPIETIADLQPAYVYEQALKNQPLQLGDEYRILAAKKYVAVAKASLYPSLAAFGSLSSNYLSFNKRPYYQKILNGYQSTGLVADAGTGVLYDVQSPIFSNGNVLGYVRPGSLSKQFNDNLRKSIGISINVPLFNGGSAKSNLEKSKLNVGSALLQKEKDDQQLKQDIYQAYTAAITALEKFNASKKAIDASRKTFEFAQKRFEIGALSTFDLISAQNNLLRAQLENTINQFDYVFKMKVLEFYKGAGLKL